MWRLIAAKKSLNLENKNRPENPDGFLMF